jgi:hypothetical protein
MRGWRVYLIGFVLVTLCEVQMSALCSRTNLALAARWVGVHLLPAWYDVDGKAWRV